MILDKYKTPKRNNNLVIKKDRLSLAVSKSSKITFTNIIGKKRFIIEKIIFPILKNNIFLFNLKQTFIPNI